MLAVQPNSRDQRFLRDELSERQRGQRLQAALFRITELASEHGSLDVFCEGVHRVVSELLNAGNFFIGLLSADGDELTFPYFVDQRDQVFRRRRLSNGITEWVIRHRRPLLVTESRLREFREAEGLRIFGTPPKCWLGVPLLLDDVAVGAMVVQSYDAEDDYGQAEQEILQFASYHIAAALERKQAQERLQLAYAELERRVETRTEELRQVNEDLLL